MSLQNDGICLLIAGCRLLHDHHVVGLILIPGQIMLFCKSNQIITDGLCVPRTVRNRTDLLKIIKHFLRL